MPKKAKKGGKGGALTEEERLLLLQRRAEAEEEANRKKEEMLMLFLKDKLQKEQRNTEVNLLKLNEGWRSMLRHTRDLELRRDVTVLRHTFESNLDVLDSIIKILEREMLEAERQSAQVRRTHLQNLDRLWAQQEKRLMVLQTHWDKELGDLTTMFIHERRMTLEESRQYQQQLQDAMFGEECQSEAVMDETCKLYSELISSYQSARHCSMSSRSLRSEEQNLQKQEDEKLCSRETKRLEELILTNKHLVQATNDEMKRVKRLQGAIIHLKQKLNSDNVTKESAEQHLTANVNQVKEKTRELRQQLQRAQLAARKQLTVLTVQSSAAAKKLQAAMAKGEKVVRLDQMCHKLEKDQENMTLYCLKEPERTGAQTAEPTEVSTEFPELKLLMLSINTAVLRREALRKHKDNLTQQNHKLRILLRQHLDAMTVDIGTFRGPHVHCLPLPDYDGPTQNREEPERHQGVHTVTQLLRN